MMNRSRSTIFFWSICSISISIFAGIFAARGCYIYSSVSVYRWAAIGAVPFAVLGAFLFRYAHGSQGGFLEDMFPGSFIFGSLGFLLIAMWANALPAITDSTTKSFDVRYIEIPNFHMGRFARCQHMVKFYDDDLKKYITVCGPSWGLSSHNPSGIIKVTVQVGKYGIKVRKLMDHPGVDVGK